MDVTIRHPRAPLKALESMLMAREHRIGEAPSMAQLSFFVMTENRKEEWDALRDHMTTHIGIPAFALLPSDATTADMGRAILEGATEVFTHPYDIKKIVQWAESLGHQHSRIMPTPQDFIAFGIHDFWSLFPTSTNLPFACHVVTSVCGHVVPIKRAGDKLFPFEKQKLLFNSVHQVLIKTSDYERVSEVEGLKAA